MYQDTDTRVAEITALIQPPVTIPAQLAPYIPPPQPTIIPGRNGQPGVIVDVDGQAYYGHAPIVYAQPQPMGLDPQASRMVGQAAMMAGGGVLAAGVGTGVAEMVSAVAGAGVAATVAAAALILVGAAKAPRRISTTNNIREEYHQTVTNNANGWFGKATGSVNSRSSHTTSSTIS